jgi:hypothetical protein
MKICVNCRPGQHGEQEPSVFHLGGTRLPVVSIVDRWQVPSHHYYRVTVRDGRRFVLRHDPSHGTWELSAVYGPVSATSGWGRSSI